jgi:hypothetical protein
MKKPLTPEQLEAIKKKYASKGYDEYDINRLNVQKVNSQPPEGSKEQGKE